MMEGRARVRQVLTAYAISGVVWIGIAFLLEWQYLVLVRMQRVQVSLADTLPMAIARGLGFALLTPPIFYIVCRYPVGKGRLGGRLIGYLLGTIPFVVLFSCIRFVLLPPWDDVHLKYVSRSWGALVSLVRTGFADQIVIYFAIVVAAHAYKYFEQARAEELERSELQEALATSELQALRIQLHPHFLFNTLHGIATLVDTEPKIAKAMIVSLSSLLRTALKHSASDLTSLQEEMEFIRSYLDIEKLRLGRRLTVRFEIAPDTAQMLVPQLILQPLVENAIVHGISCNREGGWMEVASRASGDSLEVEIRNSVGSGEGRKGVGLGMQNTTTRLKYLYNGTASLKFIVNEDRIAIAKLTIPALRSMGEVTLTTPLKEPIEKDHLYASSDRR